MLGNRLWILGQSTRILIFGGVVTFLLTIYMFFPTTYSELPSMVIDSRVRSQCTPQEWSNGNWTPRTPPTSLTTMSRKEDVLQFAGFPQGCASDREYFWHFAADQPEQWDRFPGAMSWKWTPSEQCHARALESEALVQDMVENGGWLLIGGAFPTPSFDGQVE